MDTVREMLASKRHLAALASIAVIALNKKMGLDLTETDVYLIAGLVATLIGGQSLSDSFGKGKVREEEKIRQEGA